MRIEELVDVDEHVVLIGTLEDLDRRGVTGRPLVLLWVFLAGSVDSVLECRSREHALQLVSRHAQSAEERDATAAERDAAADRRDDEAGLRDRDAELIETAVAGLEGRSVTAPRPRVTVNTRRAIDTWRRGTERRPQKTGV